MSAKRAQGAKNQNLETSKGITYLASQALRRLSEDTSGIHDVHSILISAALESSSEAELSLVVERLLDGGYSLRAILLELIPSTVEKLGEDWMTDNRSWTEVTIATANFQSFVRKHDFLQRDEFDSSGRVLIIVPKGENHSFGAAILQRRIAELGHYAELCIEVDPEQIDEKFDIARFDLIGFSAYRPESLQGVSETLAIVKSINESVPCVLGGKIVEFDLGQLPDIECVTNDVFTALDVAGLSSDPVHQKRIGD